jgi:hypothetical protein
LNSSLNKTELSLPKLDNKLLESKRYSTLDYTDRNLVLPDSSLRNSIETFRKASQSGFKSTLSKSMQRKTESPLGYPP